MMRIVKSHSSAAVQYFSSALSREGAYLADKQIKSYWKGEGSKILGLYDREVSQETFSKLVRNVNPNTNQRLTPRTKDSRVSGYDLSYSVVKSISILRAITQDPEIKAAIDRSNTLALKEIEQHVMSQNNTMTDRITEDTKNVIVASFFHETSRPVKTEINGKTSYVSCPNDHFHNYFINATYSHQNERFQAIEMRRVYDLAPYFESFFHSHLSKEMSRIGYAIERTPDRFEVKGITREMIDKYSLRTRQIEALMLEKNITDPKAKAQLGALSRESKSKSTISDKELHENWIQRLSPSELNTIQNLKGKYKASDKPITPGEAIDKALEASFERKSVVQEKRLLATAMSYSYGTLVPSQLEQELSSRKDLLRSEENGIVEITTRELVRLEDDLLLKAAKGKGVLKAINPTYEPKASFLSDEQRNAVKSLLKSTARYNGFHGSAGAGKSTTLSSIADGMDEVNHSYFACAPSTKARDVLRAQGFKAETIAALLHRKELQKGLKGTIIVDEATLIGHQTGHQLMSLAEEKDLRILFSFDVKQHHSVQAGDFARVLKDKAKINTVHVKKVRRQQVGPYRDAVQQMANGQTLEGFKALKKLGCVQEVIDYEERMQAISKEYISAIKNKEKVCIISPTKAEGALLTQNVRMLKKKEGLITGKERTFDTLTDMAFLNADKKDFAKYTHDLVVRFTRNQKGNFKAGGLYEVLPKVKQDEINVRDIKTGEIKKLNPDHSEHFSIYRKDQLSLAKGDVVKITVNGTVTNGGKISNGTKVRVVGFSPTGDIKLDNGKHLSKDYKFIKHGIVDTSQGSQGDTVRHVIISQSSMSFPASNTQQIYVSVSRGTHRCSIITDDIKELQRVIARNPERKTAREVAEKDEERRRRERKQREFFKQHQPSQTIIKDHGRDNQPKSEKLERDISKPQRMDPER